ncbi:hypothetical protein GOP47_0019570 [Adiantum capillus-veneris]|uniref:C2H2-type domain-containing protein n=1 Tax=Adiantum capillus-veneris TaxID=13818 RepID=A0A9D4UBS0_ADICA|nr:hypothetical protein GOP47_0019570 [Adiantum capillus-veneris]
MADEHKLDDPLPFHASSSRGLQNPPPISTASSTHIPHFRPEGPPEGLSKNLIHSERTQEYCLRDRLSSRVVLSSLHRIIGKEPHDSDQDAQPYVETPQDEEQGKNEGDLFKQGNDSRTSGRVKHHPPHMHAETLPFAALTQKNPRGSVLCDEQVLENPRASAGEGKLGNHEAFADKASFSEGSQYNIDRSSHGESENTNQHSDGSSSEKDMINHLAVHDGVSPLRALSHIAHIKRKQDCLQTNVEQLRPDLLNQFAVDVVQAASSSKRKKLKHVQLQLEPLAYQKLMKILVDQHQGSFERFIMATLDSISMEHNSVKRAATIPRKPVFSKWKRTRFDQLKGNETEELALAFRSLADSTPNVEVMSDLMQTPWQELNMLQVQKMLEETKKMLLINEKVHDCPFANCDRRFSTPGSLKDHLNEHSGEQPYSCSFEDCPHRFRSKQHLCRHLKKHERAHTCTFEGCNKRFAFRERLIVHQKIHSDERPLSCPWEGCGKTFKWANSLHGHMRTHTGEKPFQCTFAGCGRLFGYKVDLTRHRRTHFGQPARANH